MKWTIKDSRGRESATLTFVALSWLAVWGKYILAGLAIPHIGTVPPMTATEFSFAAASILAIWLGREWTEKKGS